MTPDARRALARETYGKFSEGAADGVCESCDNFSCICRACACANCTAKLSAILAALEAVERETREECAKIADNLADAFPGTVPLTDGIRRASLKIAAAIRSQGAA